VELRARPTHNGMHDRSGVRALPLELRAWPSSSDTREERGASCAAGRLPASGVERHARAATTIFFGGGREADGRCERRAGVLL
jgi:hypothetical protein